MKIEERDSVDFLRDILDSIDIPFCEVTPSLAIFQSLA